LETAHRRLAAIIEQHGPQAVGVLLAPNATLEELYLAQKLARALGIENIDHRLRQVDFSDQASTPVFPWLGQPLQALEQLDAALIIGSNVRMEQPLVGHRLRKAALAGGKIMFINPRDYEFRFPVAASIIADPAAMITALAAVVQAAMDIRGGDLSEQERALLEGARVDDAARRIAENLVNGQRASILLGNVATAHPAFSRLRALAVLLAQCTEAGLGYLPEAANSVGAWLAGALPHRTVGGKSVTAPGLDARAMLEAPRRAYMLFGLEPGLDCGDPATALNALRAAECVIAMTPFAGHHLKSCAHIILPVTAFSETAGTYVNAEGRWQSFAGAVKPRGEARPAWKVWRVLGNRFKLPGFEYLEVWEVLEEMRAQCENIEPRNLLASDTVPAVYAPSGLTRIADVPIYALDPLVRRSAPLQKTPLAGRAEIRLHPEQARALGLSEAQQARVSQNGNDVVLPLVMDEGIAPGCVWIPAGLADTLALGPAIGPIEISVPT
jgi:NADH-quinone oxidoreductase subunit G